MSEIKTGDVFICNGQILRAYKKVGATITVEPMWKEPVRRLLLSLASVAIVLVMMGGVG